MQASSIVSLSLSMAMTSHGYGNSMYTLSASDRINALKFSNFSIFVNGFNMAFLKISIGAALLRIGLGKTMYVMIWVAIVLSILCNAMVIPGTFFQCRPMEAIWNKGLPVGSYTCWSKSFSVVASYIQTDLFFTIGPLIYLSKIKVSVYNKWALRGVFVLGLSASACAIAKCWELPKLATTQDPTWDGVNLTIWARAEFNSGLIGACAPSLKSIFEQFLHDVVGIRSLKSSTPSGTPGYGGYGPGSYKLSRMSRHNGRAHAQKLPGEEEEAMPSHHRGHFVSATGGKTATDSDSIEEEDQKHILKNSHARSVDIESNGSDGGYRSPSGVSGNNWITKTVEYGVKPDSSSINHAS
ncbi:hypothetical protein TruAng_010503 [Truncatella angustata]|nr:hypothetical protein TruAng_010503 [Truncatella angustata]